MLTVNDYIRINSVEEALEYLAEHRSAQILAGGTDLLLHASDAGGDRILIDISDVPELQGIHVSPDGLVVGAATKMVDISHSSLLTGPLECLAQGADEVGSLQIRHLATLGGNLCNASPSADTAPPLLALDAEVTIRSRQRQRTLPLEDFFLGPGRCALQPDELLTSVRIPSNPRKGVGIYVKHKVRQVLDLAIVGVSVVLLKGEGGLVARIALGAVAPTPVRAAAAEGLLSGLGELDEATLEKAAQLAAAASTPIDDVRGTASYRKEMVYVLTHQALRQAWSTLAGKGI